MIIPIDQVNAMTLINLIEAFILREGTDYGEDEVPMERKVQQVKRQLERGEALLVYSEYYETVNIIPRDQYRKDYQE
ncbi:YheU family protein [Bowmanella sp. JS7-9]|uniref:YheU family protein n=1 Tax=Pseudobowmanella zhangzhouensis TaxID=1537679 RepID=A0ABW1XF20_9ALTE|nr:YheU family protein [Bowmanella sp. JS7-9]TBX20908.1 hypothetical protein TK45_14185 [Bowmanella sp. JS7-9]